MNCRRYRLDQVANFRDLGGQACDGGVTRYGVIFRSTALNKATEEDIAKIEHLGVRTVIDLRFPSETKELPDRLGQDMDYINCSLMGTTKLEQLGYCKQQCGGDQNAASHVSPDAPQRRKRDQESSRGSR